MRANIILLERYLNLIDTDAKSEYVDTIWDMMEKAYAYVGGFKGAKDKAELIKDSGMWKIVIRDGKITAFQIYKDAFGRKAIAFATNGTAQGKKDLSSLTKQDSSRQQSWGEVSDAAEKYMIKMGATPVKNIYAKLLLPGKDIKLDDDGYHYYRKIGDKVIRKLIVGFPKIYD
jgi:hypothetical protein